MAIESVPFAETPGITLEISFDKLFQTVTQEQARSILNERYQGTSRFDPEKPGTLTLDGEQHLDILEAELIWWYHQLPDSSEAKKSIRLSIGTALSVVEGLNDRIQGVSPGKGGRCLVDDLSVTFDELMALCVYVRLFGGPFAQGAEQLLAIWDSLEKDKVDVSST